MARLACQLGCTKTGEAGGSFLSMAVLLYELQPLVHPDQPFRARQEILSIVMEEVLRRNLSHEGDEREAGFFRLTLNPQPSTLNTQHSKLNPKPQS